MIRLFLFLLVFSASADAAGIRWTDRFPFHASPNVVSRGTGAGGSVNTSFKDASSTGSGVLINGLTGMVIDSVPVVFQPSRILSRAALSDMAVGLVRVGGPAVIIGGILAPLIYDQLTKDWKKPKNGSVPPTTNITCTGCSCSGNIYEFNGEPYITSVTTPNLLDGSCNTLPVDCPSNGVLLGLLTPCGSCIHSHGGTGVNSKHICVSPLYPVNGQVIEYERATDSDISTALRDYFNRVPASDLDMFSRANNDSNVSPLIFPATTPGPTSGPTSLPPQTTTTTVSTPAGPEVTTTTATTDISYAKPGTAPDSVTVTKTETTSTTKPDGTVDTVTRTTDPNPAETAPPAEQLDICKEHPEIIACGVAGSVDPVDIPVVDKPFTFSSEKSAAGSCPAPISFTVRGYSYLLSWSLVCDFASSIRAIVLAISWLSAAIFIFSVVRE